MAALYALYASDDNLIITKNTESRGILVVLLLETKQSLLSSFAKPVRFYVCEGFVAVLSSGVWKMSRRLLCSCSEPHTSFFAEEDFLQALQSIEMLPDAASVHNIYLERSCFALNFGLFVTNKLSDAIKLGLLYRTYLLIGVI